jgi:hypothetical protein
MHRPVYELERMPALELTRWIAFSNIEPFGEDRTDLNAAMIAAAIVNVFSSDKVELKQFMPRYGVSPEQIQKENDEKVARSLEAHFKSMGIHAQDRP